jgi:uncharacterized membrane protein SirB2
MYQLLLMVHFLSLASALGISITLFVLGLHASTLPPEEGTQLMARVSAAVRHVSIIAIALLVLSGVALVLVADQDIAQAGGWWFVAKLVSVAVVVIAFSAAQINQARARRGENRPVAARRAMLSGRLALVAAVLATIFAVMAFG